MPAKLLEFHDPRKPPAPSKVTPVDLGSVMVSIGRQSFTIHLSATIKSGGQPARPARVAEAPPRKMPAPADCGESLTEPEVVAPRWHTGGRPCAARSPATKQANVAPLAAQANNPRTGTENGNLQLTRAGQKLAPFLQFGATFCHSENSFYHLRPSTLGRRVRLARGFRRTRSFQVNDNKTLNIN
jgi:hypothetical protein